MSEIVTDLQGATTLQVWKPDPRAINTTGDGDKYAPFALMTKVQTDNLTLGAGQFVRVSSGNIPNINGTTPIGVVNGVTAAAVATAGAENRWYNKSGQTPAAGDYMFLLGGYLTA